MIKILHLGDITKIDGHKVPLVDIVTGGSPCFVAGTLVTTDTGLIPIEEINQGDRVFTHNKRYKVVKDSGCTGVKSVFNLYGMCCDKITATENHPFYARKVEKVWNNELRKYKRVFNNPLWIPLKDLSKDYYLGMPINNCSENLLNLTSEDLYLMGRYVADGYIRNTPRKDRPSNLHAVIFCIGESKYSDFISNITSYKYYGHKERTAYKVRISNKRLEYLCSSCGKGAINKRIPSFVLNLPVDLLKEFMRGYMDGDGCCSERYYSITTISKPLAYGLIQIIGKLYHRPGSLSLYHRPKTTVIEGRTVNQHDTYTIHFTKDIRKQDNAFYENGYIWFPIRRIESAGEQEVYNLSVEDDESYCANNAIVHNCQDLSIAGKREGLAGERSGLFMEQIRIVKEMREESERRLSDRGTDYSGRDIKCRFLVWENVAGAFSSGKPKGADFQAVLQEICKVVCKDCPPVPIPKEGWHYSGNLDGVGDNGTPFSVSWRLHDAQYWGVPQRRRRVCVVADFGGNTASKLLFELWGETEQSNPDFPIADIGNESEPEVQFERQSLPGNTEKSRNEGERITRTSENNLGKAISFQERGGKPGGGKGILIQDERTGALNVQCGQSVCYSTQACGDRDNPSQSVLEEKAYTLPANPMSDRGQSVCYGISPYNSNAMKSDNPNSGIYQADTTRTLDPNGGNPNCNQGGMAVVSVDRGLTINEDRTNALLSDDKDNPNICYGLDRASFNQGKNAKYDFAVEEEIAQPLVARGPGGVMTP